MIQRLLFLLISLWSIATLTFILMRAIPGDPLSQEQAMPKEVMEALRHHYHLDRPLLHQYMHYMKGLLHGDLGSSYTYKGQSINEIIGRGFPISALLGFEALCIALGSGVALGTIGALHRNNWRGAVAMTSALLAICLPSFLLASLTQLLFAIEIPLLPVARWGTFSHTLLPAFALAALPAGFIARLTRASLLDELHKEYLSTARAKGLGERATLYRHALRNATLPLLSYLGPLIANILVGSFAVEKIFGIPGMGQWFVNAIHHRDYSLIMGLSLFYGVLLSATIFLVDFAYRWLDPRIARSHI